MPWWGIGPGVIPVMGLALLIGEVSERRRRERIREQMKASGADLALHNYLIGPRHSCFQVMEESGRYAKIERSTGKVLHRRKVEGHYPGVPVENLDPRATFIYRFDPKQGRYVRVKRRTGEIVESR